MLTFGVEIECLLPATVRSHSQTAIELREAISRAIPNSMWQVKGDGSVMGSGRFGLEIVSPPLRSDRAEDFAQIDTVCEILSLEGATVNRTCGLHVHVGARDLGVPALKSLAMLYADAEDVIDSLLPPSRRADNNRYCRSIKANYNLSRLGRAEDVNAITTAIYGDRYVKLNFASYWRHGTVEFRQHSGTVDPIKIKNWVHFCVKMVKAAQAAPITVAASPAVVAVTAPIPPALVLNDYWRSGRRTRTIQRLLDRPEGATAEEVREALGVRTRPNLRWHAERAHERLARSGYRNGHAVYRRATYNVSVDAYSHPAPAPAPALVARPISSLPELLNRLQVTPMERTYWIERAAAFTPQLEAVA